MTGNVAQGHGEKNNIRHNITDKSRTIVIKLYGVYIVKFDKNN